MPNRHDRRVTATKKVLPAKPTQEIALDAIGDNLAQFADIFSVEVESASGMAIVTFFQGQAVFDKPLGGGKGLLSSNKKQGKFVSRIVLSTKGYKALLEALEENKPVERSVERSKK